MSIFTISSILIVISTSSLAVVLLLKSYSVLANRCWGFLCLCAAIYGFGAFKFSTTSIKEDAYFWWQFAYIGVILAPVVYTHFVNAYLKLQQRILLISSYCVAFCFLLINFFFRDAFIGDLKFSFSEFYSIDWMARKNIAWLIFYFLFYWGLLQYSCSLLLINYFQSSGSKKNQLKYLIVGSLIGWLGPHGIYLSYFGINIYPYSNFLLAIYPLIIGYAIVRYRLMDITLVLTRTTIFVGVYTFVLGIPFALAFGFREKLVSLFGESWWMVPLVTSTVLATVGPFIYVYFQRRAEDRLFQEQRRYQATLRQASAGMGKIKDLKRLVTLIVHIMTRTVRVEYSMVFLNDVYAKKFRLGAYRSRLVRQKFRSDIDYSTALVHTLKETQNPIVYDEIKQRTQDYGDLKLARLEAELKAMDAAIVVPSFIDEKLVAILVMGNKVSGKTYSSDDLSVFSILANQSALAVENAQFYDEMKNTHAQLLKAEKMATIGTLADGLSHQINNRLHAMGFIAGDALDTLKLGHNLPMSLEVKEMVLDLEHALNRIESNVQQGGEIVQGLLKYTRKDDAGVQDVSLDKLIEAALDMSQFKIKPGEISMCHEYPPDLPKIRGNFTQLQEVFFNLIDNAYDAMMQRKAELKETNYTPTIKIKAAGGSNGHLDVVVEDNGIGIQEQDKEKIFTPFFTTKLSSKKGTGLGLYVIQRLIEENHKGKVVYESKYKQGTSVHLTLPAA